LTEVKAQLPITVSAIYRYYW